MYVRCLGAAAPPPRWPPRSSRLPACRAPSALHRLLRGSSPSEAESEPCSSAPPPPAEVPAIRVATHRPSWPAPLSVRPRQRFAHRSSPLRHAGTARRRMPLGRATPRSRPSTPAHPVRVVRERKPLLKRCPQLPCASTMDACRERLIPAADYTRTGDEVPGRGLRAVSRPWQDNAPSARFLTSNTNGPVFIGVASAKVRPRQVARARP